MQGNDLVPFHFVVFSASSFRTLHHRSGLPAVSCAKCTEGSAHEHTGPAEAIRLSLRDGVTVSSALSLVTGLSCHHRPREALLLTNLAPASGRQDHTASPSAIACARQSQLSR